MASTLKLTQVQLGSSATPALNFLLKVPDTPDGTLAITRGDGTAVLNIDAAGKAVFPGNAQTLQDVKANRAPGTPYANDTSQTIVVIAALTSTAAAAAIATLDGKTAYGTGATAGNALGITLSVPPGKTYSITTSAGTPTVFTWLELR